LESLRASGEQNLDAAWIRSDLAVAYPVRKGIPLLVPGEAIPLQSKPPTPKENLSHD